MKKYAFKSIRTRFTFWFLLLTLLPLLIVLIVTYHQRVDVIETRTFDKLTAIRDLKVERLRDWLKEREGDTHNFSADKELTELEHIIQKTSYDQNDINIIDNCRRILNRCLKNYSTYHNLFIINPLNGNVIVSTNKSHEGNNRSDNLYFKKPMQLRELFIKDIYYSRTLSVMSMAMSIPIFNVDKSDIVGVFVARIDLSESLYKMLLDRVGLGETGETLIVNSDVVALNELRWYDNAPMNLQIFTEAAVNAAQGKTGITITDDYHDEKTLAAYTHIPETRWGFVCKQDLYELNAPIREMINNFIIIFLITGILITLVALIISKSISRPIIEIDAIAQQFSSGDFSVRNEISSLDELGSLASKFNLMADMTESRLQIQKGVVDISETIIGKSSMQEFSFDLLKQLMEITSANMGTFYILNEASMEYEHFVSVGANKELLKSFSAENPEGEFGNVLSKKSIYYLRDIPEDTVFKFQTTAGNAIPKEIITIPILVEDTVVVLISLVNIHKFSKDCYDILKQSLLAINTSYSDLMANERTRILAEQLTRTNQQLEAQTEELQNQTEELKGQNLELEMQRNQVEEATRLKSEFLSNMSHELRTPLNSIMALSRVLIMQAKDKLSEEENNYLEIVERNGKQLLSLINDILDLSKIEAGKMDFYLQTISLKTILNNIGDSLQPIVREKDLYFKMDIADDLPMIETDDAKLHQVLQNIISNSVKFTEKGGVDILVKYNSEKVCLTIKDTGIGIPEDELPHIFEEFRQVDGTSSRLYEGTGLGLAIAKKLIRNLGGDIQVKSKFEEGSIFIVTLPIKWHGVADLPNISTFQALRPEPEEKIILAGLEKVRKTSKAEKIKSETRILLVEDNETTVIQMKVVLEREGYKLDVTRDGRQALEYIKHTIPDGIILDLMMPEVDGFEVLEKIRNTEATRRIPVLILTAKNLTREDLSRLSANHIQQLVQKGDIGKEKLLFKIQLMLGNEPHIKEEEKRKKVKDKVVKSVKQIRSNRTTQIEGLPRVLVVEDNPDNMTTIKAILKDDYNVLEAYDGKQGLNIARTELPDVILLDIALPKMDGMEVVNVVKNSEELKNIPVIAVTARAMKADRDIIMAAGFDDYISKPIDQKLLLKRIEKWLRR